MQLGLDRIFGDNMVIQRDKPFYIRGTAEPGTTVRVAIQDQKTAIRSAEDGKWETLLAPMETSWDEKLEISCEGESLSFSHIVIGEVWLACGQSNMEFQMLFDQEYEEEKKKCTNTEIRFFDYPEVSYEGQEQDFDYSDMGVWRVCDEENLKFYSAAAYYFGQKLQKELQVPVGIIGCNWGGTTASCWMSEEYLKKHGQVWIDDYLNNLSLMEDKEEYIRNYRSNPANSRGLPFQDAFTMLMLLGISREKQLLFMGKEAAKKAEEEPFIMGPYSASRPCGLYKFMLKKIAPYRVRGVLWYQGESDDIHSDIYADVLADLIDCWRQLWREELPFYIVQLAPYEIWLGMPGTEYPKLREAQRVVADTKSRTYLISTSDAGMRYDVHPKKKRPIGERLALAALKEEYGRHLLWKAPVAKWGKLQNGDIVIEFENAGNGLFIKGNHIQSLEVIEINADGKRQLQEDEYSVEIGKDRLIIQVVNKRRDYCIKFACTPYYEVNLCNSAGIPAVPFELEISEK